MSIKIKICGITEPESLRVAVKNGARFIGFVFVPKSPRYIAPADAAELARMLPAGVRAVGLFVDPTDEQLTSILGAVPLDYLQLHGAESPARVQAIQETFHLPIIKALNIESAQDIARARDYESCVDWFIFDAPADTQSGLTGGTGHCFDWRLLEGLHLEKPWMLSGGLNADNVKEALALAKPDGVDVSSGVETTRGVKDIQKIKDFIKAVK